LITEIASAVLSVPLGDLSLVLPSSVDAVAQLAEDGHHRRISVFGAGGSAGSSSALPS
jgi:hypothetical protein